MQSTPLAIEVDIGWKLLAKSCPSAFGDLDVVLDALEQSARKDSLNEGYTTRHSSHTFSRIIASLLN